jgi:hypothetical protein
MKSDVSGRVKNMNLPYSRSLMPLFEAIINSIHAIEEAAITDGSVKILVERDESQGALLESSRALFPISHFKVVDNGIGFNDRNYTSFGTSDSTSKAEKGAKGIGRFLWLKCFQSVHVSSIFVEAGRHIKREFDFEICDDGILNFSESQVENQENKTEVYLKYFQEGYRKASPQKPETLAKRIIEHCLVYFLSPKCPTISVLDGDEQFNLNQLFEVTIEANAQTSKFTLKSKEFEILKLRLYDSEESEHRLYFCAQNREVFPLKLSKYIPDLQRKIKDNSDKPFIYMAYISGKYLDEKVNAERTSFNMIEESEISFPDEITLDDLKEESIAQTRKDLKPFLSSIRDTKFQAIQRYVTTKAPQFRPLLKHKREALDSIPPDISEDKLDIELYKLQAKVVTDIKEAAPRFLNSTIDDVMQFPEYVHSYNKFIEQFNDFGKANLAQYIVHRKALLDLFTNNLKKDENGKYSLERDIHELIFPLRATSDDIDFEHQNLWIIDEKLAYHKYLASDKEFSQMSGEIAVQSAERPDVIVFNHPFAFVEGETPYSSIVVIEFKRPMRDDYDDRENPISQVYGYIKKIQSGEVRDKDGRPMPSLANMPFYSYIICDLTPKIKEFAEFNDFTLTPDQLGYFNFNKILNTYIEIISFDKLIADAKKRNRVLFDKLQLRPT